MEFIQQNLYLVIPAVVSGTLLLFFTYHRPGSKNKLTTTQATLLMNREDAYVIDVRDAGEYAGGHVPESKNIPLSELEARAADLEKYKETPLIIVCQTGARSAKACTTLAKQGFAKVHNLEGGIQAWRDDGLPLKKGSKK